MATGTLDRSRLIFLVAVDTLRMKGICTLRGFGIFKIFGFMAVKTGARGHFTLWRHAVAGATASGIGFFLRMMVTILAGNTVTGFTQMGLMVKKHPSSYTLKH